MTTVALETRNVNTVRLIAAVKEHPCIWDSGHPEYRSKTEKKQAWSAVARDVMDQWREFTRTDQHNALLILVRRWNNIRDYYNKSLKADRAVNLRGSHSKKRDYVYADALKFLRPELEKNLRLRSSTDVKMEYDDDEVEIEEVEEEESLNDITFVEALDYETPQTSKTKLQEGDNYESSIENTMRREEDHDLMFLKSLLPDMRKLHEEEKFEFKYAIMTAYMNIIKKRTQKSQEESD